MHVWRATGKSWRFPHRAQFPPNLLHHKNIPAVSFLGPSSRADRRSRDVISTWPVQWWPCSRSALPDIILSIQPSVYLGICHRYTEIRTLWHAEPRQTGRLGLPPRYPCSAVASRLHTKSDKLKRPRSHGCTSRHHNETLGPKFISPRGTDTRFSGSRLSGGFRVMTAPILLEGTWDCYTATCGPYKTRATPREIPNTKTRDSPVIATA